MTTLNQSHLLTFVIRGKAEQTTANQKVEPSMGDYEAANNRSNSRGILQAPTALLL